MPRIINDTTAHEYPHESTLNLGYINQSRRYALPPNIATAKNSRNDDVPIPARETLVNNHSYRSTNFNGHLHTSHAIIANELKVHKKSNCCKGLYQH